ncbi:MAG: hypothetical protein ACLGIK_06420 [Gemmatimonadota bacterium]
MTLRGHAAVQSIAAATRAHLAARAQRANLTRPRIRLHATDLRTGRRQHQDGLDYWDTLTLLDRLRERYPTVHYHTEALA